MSLDGIEKWRDWTPTPDAIRRALIEIGRMSAATAMLRVASAVAILAMLVLLLAHAGAP